MSGNIAKNNKTVHLWLGSHLWFFMNKENWQNATWKVNWIAWKQAFLARSGGGYQLSTKIIVSIYNQNGAFNTHFAIQSHKINEK